MRLLRIAVVHREGIAGEAIASALGSHPHLLAVGTSTSTARASEMLGIADAFVVDDAVAGCDVFLGVLRRAGHRIVLLSDRAPADDGEGVRVPRSASIEELATVLAPQVVRQTAAVLTPQQRLVLSLVAKGLTARQVARQLGISHKTVEQHKTRIFQKLGVPNQAAAVRVALTIGAEGSVA